MRMMANVMTRAIATLSTLMVVTTLHGQTIRWLIPSSAQSSEGTAVANDGTAIVIASMGSYWNSYYTSAGGEGPLQWFGGPSDIRLVSISEATDAQGRKYVCGWFPGGDLYGIYKNPLSSLQTSIQGYYFTSISTDAQISVGHDRYGASVYWDGQLRSIGAVRFARAVDRHPSGTFVIAGRGIQPSWQGGPSATDGEFHCVRMTGDQSFVAGGQGFIIYSTGVSVQLPVSGIYTNPVAYSITVVDNKIIAGGSAGGRAVRWICNMQGGLVSFEDLTSVYANILPAGSVLQTAKCISPNGRWIIGTGRNGATGRTEAFLLDTGSGCVLPGDVNGDGRVNDADLLTVLFNFGSRCN